jgi:signal transduction histidine kinase
MRAAGARDAANRSTATASRSAEGFASTDLDALLAHGLARLAAVTGATRGVAWCRDASGAPLAVTAKAEGPQRIPLGEDDRSAMAEALRLGGSFDLGSEALPAALAALPKRLRLAAGGVVRSNDGQAVAALWIGGGDLVPGRVRPRVLAAIAEITDRLRDPISGIAALHRLARIDAETRRVDRLAALGDLVSEIVHEIRNPLVSIKTFLQLLPERADDPEFRGEFRDMVAGEVERMERLLDTVVRHARPPAASEDEAGTELASVVESACDLLRYRALDRELSLQTQIPAGLPRLAIHEDSLRQVVVNLVLNAIEATAPGGEVSVVAEPAEGGAEIRVDDQGSGIAPERRARVFEPFFSTRVDRPGGLGLAITRRLVDESGGSIGVEEAPGGGARFRVRLARV